MAERIAPAVRYVSVEGPVTRAATRTDELLQEIATQYLPQEKAPAYIEFARKHIALPLCKLFLAYARNEVALRARAVRLGRPCLLRLYRLKLRLLIAGLIHCFPSRS